MYAYLRILFIFINYDGLMLMFNFTTTSSMLLMKQTQHDSLVVVFIGNMELGGRESLSVELSSN